MVLRIIYDENEYYDYDLGEYDTDKFKILTSLYPVCEIEIMYFHNIDSNEEPKFNKIAKEIQSKPFILIKEVQILNKNKVIFKQNRMVKTVLYRDLFYSAGHNLVKEEVLTFKFQENCKAIIDREKEQIFCDKKNCMYFNNGYCENYKTKLYQSEEEFIPCYACFLECETGFKFSEIYSFYIKLQNKVQDEGHLPYQPYTIRDN